MVWPFSKKKTPQTMPSKLPFKSGADFLEYQCKFGFTDIKPKQGIVALVLDAKEEFGAASAVSVEPDGQQMAALKVASEDGGFLVMAQTHSPGDRLKPGDVVIWAPVSYSNTVPPGTDQRFGWIGFIIAKIEPEIDMSDPNFKIICKYTA